MIRRRFLIVVLQLYSSASACGRQGPTDRNRIQRPRLCSNSSEAEPTLLALYRFWDTRHNEHVYTYGDGEPAAWRKNPAFNGEVLVGYIAVAPQPNAVRLYRVPTAEDDERHYFYVTKPGAQRRRTSSGLRRSRWYVWTRNPATAESQSTRASCRTTRTGVLRPGPDDRKEHAAGTLKQIGKQRKVVEAMFYVYPTAVQTTPPPAPKPPTTPPTEHAVRTLRGMGAQVIQDRGTITQVVFTERRATDEAIPYLKALPGLRTLDLNWNRVTNAVLEQTQGSWPDLEELGLDGTEVTDSGISRLEKATPRLQSLSLTGNRGVIDIGIARLTKLPLRQLHISKTQVTDAGLASVKELSTLEELYCGHRAITDVGVEHLKDMPNLRSLALGETSVTDTGLVHVSRLTKLEFLVLDGTAVTDAGLAHLKGLKSLKRLRLADTAVTPEGEAALKKAIPHGLAIER